MRKLEQRRLRRLVRAVAVTTAMLVAAGALTSLERAVPAGAASSPVAAAATSPVSTDGVLYTEDFENRPTGSVRLITDYVGVDGRRYGADPLWADLNACNGFILDHTSVYSGRLCARGGKGSTVFGDLQRLVLTLGEYRHEKDPVAAEKNAAMAAMTEGSTNSDQVMLRTANLIDFGTVGRFVTFAVDVASMNCDQFAPMLSFSLVPDRPTAANPSVEVAAVNACELPYVRDFTVGNKQRPVLYGPLLSDGALLVGGGQYRLVMKNQETTGAGNDAAVDNFKLVDGTPTLGKSFAPASAPVGGRSTLTYTITNTTDLGAKDGWNFTDVLPAGLKIAPAPNTPNVTCEKAAVTATPGSNQVVVNAGKIARTSESCTVSVDVTSDTPQGDDPSPKTYTSGPEQVTRSLALKKSNTASVSFFSTPKLSVKKTTTATADTRVGDTVGYTVTAKNIGNGSFTASNKARLVDDLTRLLDDADLVGGSIQVVNKTGAVIDTGPAAVVGGRIAWEGKLLVGESVIFNYSAKVKSGGDGRMKNVAFASKPGLSSEPIPACPSNPQDAGSACTETLLPRLVVAKTAARSTSPQTGDAVTYTVTATNAGPGAFTSTARATITDDLSQVIDDAEYGNDAVVSPNLGTLQYTAPRLTWNGPIAAGAKVTLKYSVKIREAGDGTVRNVAFVGGGATPSCSEAQQQAGSCAMVEYRVLRAGVTWQKVSASAHGSGQAETYLRGSEWRLAPLRNNGSEISNRALTVIDCVENTASACQGADKDPAAGKMLVKPLALGKYRLTETKAPLGYTLQAQPRDFVIAASTLNGDSNFDLGSIANVQKAVPVIPLTGGLGEHAFWIVASGALAIALIAMARRHRHRRGGASHAA